MNELLKKREEYLRRKMSHLLFEILEYPPKKELLYIGLCYCQLSRIYNLDEIPISEIKNCLSRYLIDFDSYPWRDYLLELEFFYMREGENTFVKGAGLMVYTPSEEATVSIDPRYGFLKNSFCQKVYRYWYISQKWGKFRKPNDGWEVIENAVRLFNEGLYEEASLYLEDYLPYIKSSRELITYRVIKKLSTLAFLLDKERLEEALGEIKHLKEFLKEFNKELKALPFDIGKLSKELKKLEKTLKGGKKVYLPPIRLERKKKKSLLRRLLNLFKGLPIFR
ncbi:MAG: hypothetical protein DSZ30_03730 [Aquificaceae bacterium]|nr:MAG: hypothetical protein DSZ30_03730 [Aquificaceae bacterium]